MTLVTFLLISLVVIATITITGINTLSCFECSGDDCFPIEQNIVDCANNATSRCFYLTGNNTDMIRGCYEEDDPNFKECQEHILNTCERCNTSLCNDQPPANDETLACYTCFPASDLCRDPLFMEHNVKPCRAFMYTDKPRCYSYYDHSVDEYEFGCLSEARPVVKWTCDHDWFKLTCRMCYQSRCNVNLFYPQIEGESKDFRCYTWENAVNKEINCPYQEDNAPYYGCYQETLPDTLSKGCISERFKGDGYIDWLNLMKPDELENRMKICSEPLCNLAEWQNTTYCYRNPVRTCVSFFNNIGNCMAVQTEPGGEKSPLCEDRFTCWKTDMCVYKCTGAHVQSSNEKISCLDATWTQKFYCYSCSDCPVLVHDKLGPVIECSNKQCAEVVVDGVLHRGCRKEEWNSYCSGNESSICRFCDTEYCNSDSYGIHCITCSYDNNLCTYDPVNTFNDLCNIPIAKNMSYGCYTQVRVVDGLVERGCFGSDTYECQDRFECETCEENFCNTHLFIVGSCLNCSGGLESDCALNTTYLSLEKISAGDCKVLYDVPLCYTILTEDSVLRGCTSDEYLPSLNKDCGPDEECFFCDASDCNYMTRTLGGVRNFFTASSSVRWNFIWLKWMGFLSMILGIISIKEN